MYGIEIAITDWLKEGQRETEVHRHRKRIQGTERSREEIIKQLKIISLKSGILQKREKTNDKITWLKWEKFSIDVRRSLQKFSEECRSICRDCPSTSSLHKIERETDRGKSFQPGHVQIRETRREREESHRLDEKRKHIIELLSFPRILEVRSFETPNEDTHVLQFKFHDIIRNTRMTDCPQVQREKVEKQEETMKYWPSQQ